jgi:hypothetical protein
MLSHHDRSELAKIEHSLELTDPELAAMLRDGKRPPSGAFRTVLVFSLDVVAIVLLVTGLVVADPALILVAVLALAGAVWVHAARRHTLR